MRNPTVNRRSLISSGAASAAVAIGAGSAFRPGQARASDPGIDFAFEVARSDAEWRDMLSPEEFNILREGSTELPKTSPLRNETAAGTYCCRGCDLTLYESVWKVPLEIGWVFFSHSIPRTVLTSIDGQPPAGMGDDSQIEAMIEVHCRRCGSHLGHIVHAEKKLVHCINGTSLTFQRNSA
ncbi:MAG: peptide-methionine (R)-S-oxide reductase [Silicimonas sp.]|nr:peptide-methionine (R)-S-oxide reductase [Silicimonas sp.]